MKKVYYTKLRELMAKHLMNKTDVAKIIGKTYRQTLKKLHKETSGASGKPFIFDSVEIALLIKHFRNLGEDKLTVEELFPELFFNPMFSNENVSCF